MALTKKKPDPMRRLGELVANTADSDDERDKEILAVSNALVASGDVKTQRAVLEQLRRHVKHPAAWAMASALVGRPAGVDHHVPRPEKAARPAVLRELHQALLPDAGDHHQWLLWAALLAVLLSEGRRAPETIAPLLDVTATSGRKAIARAAEVASFVIGAAGSRTFIELVARAASRTGDWKLASSMSSCLQRGPATEVAHLLELDLTPTLVHDLVRDVATSSALKIDRRQVKRILPALRAAAARLRDDTSARPRIEAAEKAIELPGGLSSPKGKSLPKAPPTIALEHETGTDGGPVVALPKEAVALWGGSHLPNGKATKEEGNFKGTDYGRACAISSGFIDVGKLRGLVLGEHCSVAKCENGSWLLVMEGEGEEIAAFLKQGKRWRRLAGTLDLPSGQLVLFDAAYPKAKTNNKSALNLEPGRYVVEEHDTNKLSLLRLRHA